MSAVRKNNTPCSCMDCCGRDLYDSSIPVSIDRRSLTDAELLGVSEGDYEEIGFSKYSSKHRVLCEQVAA